MSKIRIGVIGAGGISHTHMNGIERSPDMELTAVCDIDPEALARAGDERGIPPERRFLRHSDLLASPAVDAVSICTPNDSHFAIAMDAVRCRKPFALEKPVTLNAGQARELRRAVDSAGLPNMVCFSYRFKTAARYARDFLRKGGLGKIYHVYAQYFQSWAVDENLPLIWRFRKDITGSGSLGDLGSHALDLVRFLLGDIARVSAHAGTFITSRAAIGSDDRGTVDVDDFCNVLAELEGGVPAVFCITRYAPGRGNHQRIEVYGEKGSLIYRLEENDTVELCLNSRIGHAAPFQPVDVPEEYRADQMQSFADIVLGHGDGLAATMADGLANQLALDAILTSIDTHQWVTIEKE